MEEWRSIEGYGGICEVSDAGRVKSVARRYSDGRNFPDRIMKTWITKAGREQVRLTASDGKEKTRSIHTLVADAFIPNPHNYPVVRHKDDDPLNNKLDNLARGTHWDNMADKHGFTPVAGRVATCARGHKLLDDNYTGTRCRSCNRAKGAMSTRLKLCGDIPWTRQEMADIYYVALLDGFVFKSGAYTLETLEAEYGKQAKEWRQNVPGDAGIGEGYLGVGDSEAAA